MVEDCRHGGCLSVARLMRRAVCRGCEGGAVVVSVWYATARAESEAAAVGGSVIIGAGEVASIQVLEFCKKTQTLYKD